MLLLQCNMSQGTSVRQTVDLCQRIDSHHGKPWAIGRTLPNRKETGMTRRFIVKSLATESVNRAFAVARSADFTLSLDQWRGYVLGLIECGPAISGVLAVENRAGTIQGLCTYRMEPSLAQGTVCSVEYQVALDLIDNTTVTTALLTALENLARRLGASALRLDLAYGTRVTDQLLCRLSENGHRIDRVRLVKPLLGGG